MISEFFLFPQMIIHLRRSLLILVDVDLIQTRVFISPLVHPLSNLFVSILIILATLISLIVRCGYIHSRRINNAERCVRPIINITTTLSIPYFVQLSQHHQHLPFFRVVHRQGRQILPLMLRTIIIIMDYFTSFIIIYRQSAGEKGQYRLSDITLVQIDHRFKSKLLYSPSRSVMYQHVALVCLKFTEDDHDIITTTIVTAGKSIIVVACTIRG